MPVLKNESPRVIAALHAQGTRAHLLFATVGEGALGVGGGTRPRLIGVRGVTLALDDTRAIADTLEAAGVQMLIRLLPSSSTIVRVVPMPGSSQPEAGDTREGGGDSRSPAVGDALALVAETELPTNLPMYRRAVGVIQPSRSRARSGESQPAGLICGWPVPAGQERLAASWRSVWPCPEVWIAEIAALAVLSDALGGSDCAAWIDRDGLCGCVVASGGGGGGNGEGSGARERTLARVFRLPAGSSEAKNMAAMTTINETRGVVGLGRLPESPEVAASSASLRFDPEPPSSASAEPQLRDHDWRTSFGLAYGALSAFASSNPNVRSLVGLHEREPMAKPPMWERVTRWLGSPIRAAVVIALCLALILGASYASAYARYARLNTESGGASAVLERMGDSEKRVAFSRVLREKRWPMTKLLADISGAAPVGVTIESLELNAAQTDGVTVRGVADSSDLVTNFRENLGKTRIFTGVTTPTISTQPSSGDRAGDREVSVVQFQLQAKIPVGTAIYPAKPIDDFAEKTLSDRLYAGKGAGGKSERSSSRSRAAPARPNRAERTGASEPAQRFSARTSSDARASGGSAGRSSAVPATPTASSASGAAPVVPPPLTDTQIAKLDQVKAMLEWAQRKKAATQTGLDDATKQRLVSESEKAKARMDELKKTVPVPAGGGGGGGT